MSIHVDTGACSINKYGEELCGDKTEILRTDDSVILVLADGLGSGVKANILSTLTSKIIGTMLKEGASLEDAVSTIAKTLPVCNVRQLAYSTFSILQIFKNGEAYLAEFDNPSCIFIRDNMLMELPLEEREISGKLVKECRFNVKGGDVLTIVSDGAIYAGVGATLNFGWKWENVAEHIRTNSHKDTSALRLATSLIQACKDLYLDKPGDDTTVMTAKVMPEKIVNLISGTPKLHDLDEKMVKDFTRESGTKIVAGGSTSNMVARVLDRKIETTLDYVDNDIPPIAYIHGFDLVTEGVLTLSKTVDILREFSKPDADTDFRKLDRLDGASRMAKIILDNCTTLKLFIGTSINPAHQNPNLPTDLSIKLKIIKDLQEVCESLGKTVSCQYY